MMIENKKTTDGSEIDKLESKDKTEVEYVRKKFPELSVQAVYGAIRAAGPNKKDVIDYLKKKATVKARQTRNSKFEMGFLVFNSFPQIKRRK